MISPLDSSAQSFLVGLNQIQARAQAAQQQLTTGLKINTVSDAPDQIAGLLQVRSNLARTQQIDSNLGSVKTEVDAGESTLESAVSLVENAQTLGSQGTTGTSNAQTTSKISRLTSRNLVATTSQRIEYSKWPDATFSPVIAISTLPIQST